MKNYRDYDSKFYAYSKSSLKFEFGWAVMHVYYCEHVENCIEMLKHTISSYDVHLCSDANPELISTKTTGKHPYRSTPSFFDAVDSGELIIIKLDDIATLFASSILYN